jgi:hypothetical protein
MKATSENWNIKSRTVETAAGLAFGVPVFQGSHEHGVVAGATQAGTAAGAAVAGNTGNGTMGAVTVSAGAKQGTYLLTIVEPATNAGAFIVADPDGLIIGNGDVAAAFSAGGIAFTLADGATDFAAGDQFTIPVTLTANAVFVGISVQDKGTVRTATLAADTYAQYETAGVMTEGVIWVTAGAAVATGGRAYWNPATGRYTADATHVPIPNGRYDSTAAANGDLVRLAIRNR